MVSMGKKQSDNILSEEIRNTISNKFNELEMKPCPRCGNNNFTLIEGYSLIPLQKDVGTTIIGGPSIPTVVVICTKCGFINQHAMGAFGLLPEGEGDPK